MRTFDVQSTEIQAPFESAFTYIADPRTLPEWTHAFASVNGRRAVMRTPGGTEQVGLEVIASRDSGVIDWKMIFSDGQIASAWSRLVSHREDRVTYTFVLPAPPVPLETLEGALAEQSKTLATELAMLTRVLEGRPTRER
jgi:hypothetical protein